ncbi:DUF6944 family repetitive protein [Bacillus sp. FJAT-45350]|uniref:DUF6944 family repetitive protein n=1 Tax=Bacillus sp. FJAT-45350 TaxID=2011014 RepID=UPI000BB87E0B|nr:hypothetical protein [Bacillus sp. FJAT-45350]
MNFEQLDVSGSWLDAIGQILSSIGETRNLVGLDDDLVYEIIKIGEGLQAFGNALQAIDEEEPIAEIGDWIEAAGAATASIAAARQLEEESIDNVRLEALGDSLQALGPVLASLVEEDRRLLVSYFLQSIGAGLEAIGAVSEIHGKEGKGDILSTVGSWTQTSGSILQAVIVTYKIR